MSEEHLRRGDAAYQAGRFDEASREYGQACSADPASVEARCGMGKALAHLRRWDEAIACFEAALKLTPGHGPSLYHLAICLDYRGLSESALGTYERFLSGPPGADQQSLDQSRRRAAELRTKLGKEAPGATATWSPAESSARSQMAQAPPARKAGWRVGESVEGRYKVESVLGEGGFGSVHMVRDLGWKMNLAVKSPREDLVSSKASMERFVREANTWVGLGLHPHVVTCYFVRVIGGLPSIFVEYMEGGSLADWMRQGRVKGLKDCLDAAIQVCWAMEHAHRRGLVHRDLKPDNCMMTPGGVLKITDFGLAKVREGGEAGAAAGETRDSLLARLKDAMRTGRLGTPSYMAPEQWSQAAKAAEAADVRAFGVMFHELLCGKRPFTIEEGEPPDAFYLRMLESGWRCDLGGITDDGLRRIVTPCLEPDPSRRTKDFGTLGIALSVAYARIAGAPYGRERQKEADLAADTLVNQGVSMAYLGRNEESIRLFNEALGRDPTHPAAIYDRDVLQVRMGQAGDAGLAAALRDTRRTREKDWTVPYLVALAELRRGDAKAALAELDEAAKLGGTNALIERASAFAKAEGRGSLPDELFLVFPRGTEYALAQESAFKSLLARAEAEAAAGRNEKAYAALVKARGVEGFEHSSAAMDLQARLWAKGFRRELVEGWMKRSWAAHQGAVRTVRVHPGGRLLLSGGGDRMVRVWDLQTGEPQRVLQGHAGGVESIALSADGGRAASGGEDGTVRVWDLASGTALLVLTGHAGPVAAVAFTPDAKRVLSAGADKTLRVWSLDTGRELRVLKLNELPARLDVSPDGRLALVADKEGGLSLWLHDEGKLVVRHWLFECPVNGLAVPLNGDRVILSGADGTVKVLDLPSGPCLPWSDRIAGGINDACVSPDGRFAFSGGGDKVGRTWDAGSRTNTGSFECHGGAVTAVCLSPEGRYAVLADEAGLLSVWELDWECEFPKPGWTEDARPQLENFLAVRAPRGLLAKLKRKRPAWSEADFQSLMTRLGWCGFGRLTEGDVRSRLSEMAEGRWRPAGTSKAGAGLGSKEKVLIAGAAVALLGFGAAFFLPLLKGKPKDKAPAEGGFQESTRLAREQRAKEEDARRQAEAAARGKDKESLALFQEANQELVVSYDKVAEKIGVVWVTIPGGEFRMGPRPPKRLPNGNLYVFGYEGPVGSDASPNHLVNIRTFEMSKTEVTLGQYAQCVLSFACTELNPICLYKYEGFDRMPAVCVTWNQAKTFAKWVGGRLPSESEWEYAATNAGQDVGFPWGDDKPACERTNWACREGESLWFCSEEVRRSFPALCDRKTPTLLPVCSKPAGNTAQGLCDMAGNVKEWVQDAYNSSYKGAPSDGRAWEAFALEGRVNRGGKLSSSFGASMTVCVRCRDWTPANTYNRYLGFRVAKSIP